MIFTTKKKAGNKNKNLNQQKCWWCTLIRYEEKKKKESVFVDYISFIYIYIYIDIYIYINSDILADTFINVYALKKMTFINGKLHWKKKKKRHDVKILWVPKS